MGGEGIAFPPTCTRASGEPAAGRGGALLAALPRASQENDGRPGKGGAMNRVQYREGGGTRGWQ